MQQKINKKFLVFQIIPSQLVVVNSPYHYENTSSWQSTVDPIQDGGGIKKAPLPVFPL